MSYVDITVRVDTNEHGFVRTPNQAKVLVETILARDPRYSTCSMEVALSDGSGETEIRRRAMGLSSAQELAAYRETAGDELHNIFENNREFPST